MQASAGATITVINVGDATTEPVIRKSLAIGANDAIRVNLEPKDSYQTAKEIASVAKDGGYDLILCGKESIDYNGGSVPGMLAQILDLPFVNAAVGLEINGGEATAIREIDGGKETISVKLPAVLAGQKGLVDEKELIIPNMRGIMSARAKTLNVVEPTSIAQKVDAVSFESVPTRAAVKMVDADNLDELVRMLHEDAKVI